MPNAVSAVALLCNKETKCRMLVKVEQTIECRYEIVGAGRQSTLMWCTVARLQLSGVENKVCICADDTKRHQTLWRRANPDQRQQLTAHEATNKNGAREVGVGLALPVRCNKENIGRVHVKEHRTQTYCRIKMLAMSRTIEYKKWHRSHRVISRTTGAKSYGR